jgi:methylated-DNA-[protein]-cysteine S-methyltransferase
VDGGVVETALGAVAFAWSAQGVALLELPGPDGAETWQRMIRRCAVPVRQVAALPPHMRRVARRIQAHLAGDLDAFTDVVLDLAASPVFHQRVLTQARRIGPGTSASYGELARAAGSPGASRAVGQAMAKNPVPLIVPCHRVLASGGKPGGFSGFGGLATKERLRSLERATVPATFNLDDGVAFLRRSCPLMRRLVTEVGPCSLVAEPLTSVFESLARSIVYQQLTGKAAATILARVRALVPGRFTPRGVLALGPQALRSAGLSGAKEKALRDLAARADAGTLPAAAALLHMGDQTIVDALTQVRGIGPWTVQMMLIFRLGRPDVLPLADFGVRKGFAIARGQPQLPSAKELGAYGERWRPYASLASWYLWRATELPRAKGFVPRS